MKFHWKFLVAVAFCGFSAGCSEPDRVLPIDGSLNGGVYSNRFFGFTFAPPAGWTFTNLTFTPSMRKEFEERMYKRVEGRQNGRRVANFVAGEMASLMVVKRTSPITQLPEVVSFGSMPCSLKNSKISSREAIDSLDESMASRTPRATRIGEIDTVAIDGKTFSHASYSKPAHNLPFIQDYFVSAGEDQALMIILTALDPRDLADQRDLLTNSLRFPKPLTGIEIESAVIVTITAGLLFIGCGFQYVINDRTG